MWAVWTYWCSDEASSDVHNFSYAEAATESGLPPFLHPEYLPEPTYGIWLTDGEPKQTVLAELVRAPTVARYGEPIEITVQTDPWMECDLEIDPFDATLDIPAKKSATESGIVYFKVTLDPKFQGSKINYKIKCRVNSIYRANSVSGVILLGEPNGQNPDTQDRSRQLDVPTEVRPQSL
jgi:hypothetical protein